MEEPFHELSPDRDILPEVANLESGVAEDGRDYDPEALAAFWAAQFLSGKRLEDLRIVYNDSVHYGPPRAIQGVRNPFDPSVNDDNSPTLLVFEESDAKARPDRRSVSWKPIRDPESVDWDKYEKEVYERVKERWLKDFGEELTDERALDPAHFAYCWNYSQGAKVASITLVKLSYDRHGFPERVRCTPPQGESINKESPRAIDARAVQSQPAWGKKIFGRSWRVCFEKPVLSFTLLAFILSQVTLGHDTGIEEVGQCGSVFANRYAGQWPTPKWTRWCCLGQRIIHLQFHIRYFSTSNTAFARLIPEHRSEGLPFHRRTSSMDTRQQFPLVESRVAIAINTSLDPGLAHYTMVTLTDSHGLFLDDFKGDQAWSNMKLSLCGKFTGVAVFQMTICRLLREWCQRWNSVLDSISNILKTEV